MKNIALICRILVGSLFIVSGLIKVNDAIGFSYKLEEYFSVKALGFPELLPYVLPIAVFIVVGEVLLGVATLLGAWPKLTSSLILAMTIFFTWLTYYTAHCNPHEMMTFTAEDGTTFQDTPECVLSCGCFGDAIKLTPMESFYKDVALLPFAVIFTIAAFIGKVRLNDRRDDIIIGIASVLIVAGFCMAMLDWYFPVVFTVLAFGTGILIKAFTKEKVWAMALGVLLVCGITQYWTLFHLPLKDYRPYAIGQNIVENMKTAQELGLEPPKYMRYYTMKNSTTGELMEVDQDKYIALYKDSTFDIKAWQIQKELTRDEKISDGYEPKILDFLAQDFDGNDLQDSLFAMPKVFLCVMWNLKETDEGSLDNIREFANKAQAAGIPFFGFSIADYDQAENFRHEHQLAFPFIQGDEKVLKTMIRANPGVMYLENATVVNMWNGRDLPSFDSAVSSDFR